MSLEEEICRCNIDDSFLIIIVMIITTLVRLKQRENRLINTIAVVMIIITLRKLKSSSFATNNPH